MILIYQLVKINHKIIDLSLKLIRIKQWIEVKQYNKSVTLSWLNNHPSNQIWEEIVLKEWCYYLKVLKKLFWKWNFQLKKNRLPKNWSLCFYPYTQ